MQPARNIERLIEIMRALRDPDTGCPWDIEQSFATIAPYTLEEAYEVADAIQRGSMPDLCDELGDLLLQVVYHAQMASEQGSFAFDDVVLAITTKLIRRHPHVFGDEDARTAGAVKGMWERIKDDEKRQKGGAGNVPPSTLDGVPLALPALTRAEKLQKKAARVGFDWAAPGPVLAKIREELDEVEAEMGTNDQAALAEEVGDLLFAMANLARHLKVDPEEALRRGNDKFERRFRAVEQQLVETGSSVKEASLDEMETVWQQIKRKEAKG